ncbi:hypothetical protein [Clostridium beijerinckii]|uniref:hypothetical protein n=1 Tax=Clostridium beijerinckii TaxID=1520 RepID=UPI0009D0FAF6|nr:hypothetical protein [Clostridium beijerinckii]MBA8937276.1 hypothetical protein [Clostridium beijerinckii]NSA96465.1 hypothetical protein [Clostridium beijerinckii]OOM60630.1 hypothetical protein CLOBI_29180 [Clostridium beijerinckii]OOM68552.1 hypothetical protein CLBEIC_32090 [Clostridium beijerinckii]CUU46998.1 conserved protein of unknown function [Clostridium beijerinckii]
MLTTTNYRLKKPEGTDVVDIQNFNDNADIIDQALKKHDSSLSDMVYQTAGGSATAITLAIKGTLVTGYPITFIASANNGGAATTINGKKLYKPGTTTSPNLIAGKAYTVWYNSISDCFFIKASAEGDADVSNVLATKKFSNDNDTGLVGTMPNNGAVNQSLPINGSYTIPKGFHDGTGKVTQSIPTKAGTTINPSTSQQVIAAGQYLSGDQTIVAITGTATDADVVAGKTYNSAAGILRTGSATIASLGGRQFKSGSFVGNLGAVTVNLPFKPSIVYMYINYYGTLIKSVLFSVIDPNTFYNLSGTGTEAGSVGNNFFTRNGTGDATWYWYAWE